MTRIVSIGTKIEQLDGLRGTNDLNASSQKLAEAGFTRRPTWRSLPSDADEPPQQSAEPVAVVIEGTEVDLDGKLIEPRVIDWLPAEIQSLPIGTKLYAAPTVDQHAEPVGFTCPHCKFHTWIYGDLSATSPPESAPPADDEAVRLLRKAKRAHRYFDTGGDVTSCPAADDLGPCDCGADAFNAAIDAYLAKVKK